MMPPNEKRYFVHKRLLGFGRGLAEGAISNLVPGGGIALSIIRGRRSKQAGAAAKFPVSSFNIPSIPSIVRRLVKGPGESSPGVCDAPRTRDPADGICKFGGEHIASLAEAARLRSIVSAPSLVAGPCPQTATCRWPARWDPVTCRCKIFVGDQSGPNGDVTPPVNGITPDGALFHHPPAHHHPVAPEVLPSQRLRCPKRYVLGIDDKCYFGLARNSKWRKWRPGRRPMFTGGDLNAIRTAGKLADAAEDIFKDTNPAKKAVARNYRANWRKPLKK